MMPRTARGSPGGSAQNEILDRRTRIVVAEPSADMRNMKQFFDTVELVYEGLRVSSFLRAWCQLGSTAPNPELPFSWNHTPGRRHSSV